MRLALLIAVLICCKLVECFTSTSFVTSVTTVTITSTSKKLCAKLVNVTGTCRRRRNFQFENPEIQTFRQQFAPTKTLGIEVTPLNEPPSRHNYGLHSSYWSRNKSPHLQPSLYQDELVNERLFFYVLSLASLLKKATVTYTTFQTEITTQVKSGTGSFVVVGCTPSPFPFKICNAKDPLPITILPVG